MEIRVWHKIKMMNHEPPQWKPSMISLESLEAIVSIYKCVNENVKNQHDSFIADQLQNKIVFLLDTISRTHMHFDNESFWIDHKQKWQHEIMVGVLTSSWRFITSC